MSYIIAILSVLNIYLGVKYLVVPAVKLWKWANLPQKEQEAYFNTKQAFNETIRKHLVNPKMVAGTAITGFAALVWYIILLISAHFFSEEKICQMLIIGF